MHTIGNNVSVMSRYEGDRVLVEHEMGGMPNRHERRLVDDSGIIRIIFEADTREAHPCRKYREKVEVAAGLARLALYRALIAGEFTCFAAHPFSR